MSSSEIRTYRQATSLRPTELTIEDLKRLYAALLAINGEASRWETAYRQSLDKDKQAAKDTVTGSSGETRESNNKKEEIAPSDMKPAKTSNVTMPFRIEVEGENGEYVSSIAPDVLESISLPPALKTIKFDNTYWCNVTNGFVPLHQFHIVIDFSSPQAFSLARNSSFSTTNSSTVSVWGVNEIWVKGASKAILDVIQKKRRALNVLHGGGLYSTLLWGLVAPLFIWLLNRFEISSRKQLIDLSGGLRAFVYLLASIYFLIAFKMIFDYTRWLFPFVVLKERPRYLQALQKGALIVVFLGVVSSIIAALLTTPS